MALLMPVEIVRVQAGVGSGATAAANLIQLPPEALVSVQTVAGPEIVPASGWILAVGDAALVNINKANPATTNKDTNPAILSLLPKSHPFVFANPLATIVYPPHA